MPDWVVTLLQSSMRRVRTELETPGSPAAMRLLSPMEESAAHDDPLVTLMRQHALDDVFDTVESTAGRRLLTDAEAETWLEALGLVLATTMARLGVRTETDRHGLRRRDEAIIQVVYAVQLGLIDALDATPPSR